jgi:hypothetical protein
VTHNLRKGSERLGSCFEHMDQVQDVVMDVRAGGSHNLPREVGSLNFEDLLQETLRRTQG